MTTAVVAAIVAAAGFVGYTAGQRKGHITVQTGVILLFLAILTCFAGLHALITNFPLGTGVLSLAAVIAAFTVGASSKGK